MKNKTQHNQNFAGLFFCLLLFNNTFALPPSNKPFQTRPVTSQGESFLQRGQFGKAIKKFGEALEQLSGTNQKVKEIRARLALARAQSGLGEYVDAKHNLEQANQLAQSENNVDLLASVMSALGNVYLALNHMPMAEELLQKATIIASSNNIRAVTLNNLGNYYARQSKNYLALTTYRKAIETAGHNQPMLVSGALANSARLAEKNNKPLQAATHIQESLNHALTLPDTHDKAFLLMNLGRTLQQLNTLDNVQTVDYHLDALDLFTQAETIARGNNDLMALSYAVGYQGALYEREQRYDDVLTLSRRAIFFAQQLGKNDAPLLLGLWHWQSGRALREKNQLTDAIEAYQAAIDQLARMRYAMQFSYGQQQSGFDTALNPVYHEFTELLFDQVNQTRNQEQKSQLLRRVRDTIEDFKAAELRDYFQDSCVDDLRAKTRDIGEISTSALIIYPVILEDRLELLLHLPGGELINKTSVVTRKQLTETIIRWRDFLRKASHQHRNDGEKLYQWLIRPFIDNLEEWQIDTLVFVPDGELRQVPMSALWDGGQFLIEKYPVAITPGINLTDPRTIDINKARPLYAGISESIHDFPALPYVAREIDQSQSIFKGKALLNSAFTNSNLSNNLKDQSINILHLATHAEFGHDANQSFILTYDGKLSINELATNIQTFKFRDTPLDLLVLSACETARGDSRSALGLSGIAIKAGARSALGSLWKVTDEAAAGLMQDFYQALNNPGISRASALQQAQLSLMKKREKLSRASFKYPAFWSPFIIINNWL